MLHIFEARAHLAGRLPFPFRPFSSTSSSHPTSTQLFAPPNASCAGAGKTLIAAEVIRRKLPALKAATKAVLFMAPTNPLVAQVGVWAHVVKPGCSSVRQHVGCSRLYCREQTDTNTQTVQTQKQEHAGTVCACLCLHGLRVCDCVCFVSACGLLAPAAHCVAEGGGAMHTHGI